MGEHMIFTGNHIKGGKAVPFGKCRCGAYLKGTRAIEAHRELEQKSFASPTGNRP